MPDSFYNKCFLAISLHEANFIKDVGKGFIGHIISNDGNAEWNTQYNMPNLQEKIFTCSYIIRIESG